MKIIAILKFMEILKSWENDKVMRKNFGEIFEFSEA